MYTTNVNTVQVHYRNWPRLNIITCQLANANYTNTFNSIHSTLFTIMCTYQNMFRSAFAQYLARDFLYRKKMNIQFDSTSFQQQDVGQ